MNCQEYKGMIEDALDVSLQGELKANIRRHLDHCPECRDYLAMRRQEHAAFFAGVNAAYSHLQSPPDDFADRVVREVAVRRGARRGWRRLSLPRWALIAASLALMAGFVFAAAVVVDAVTGGNGPNDQERAKATDGTDATAVSSAGTSLVPSVLDISSVPSSSCVPSVSSTTPNQGENQMTRKKAATAALSAAMAAAPLAAANGDEYQFIISGDPVAEATAGSSSASSDEITLETGALRVASAADDLEARSRTKGASSAILLDATKFCGMIITIR
jgi:hypothetical protein